MVTLFNTDGDMSGRPTERDVLLVEALITRKRLSIGREPCVAAIPSGNVNMPRESANMDYPPALTWPGTGCSLRTELVDNLQMPAGDPALVTNPEGRFSINLYTLEKGCDMLQVLP